MTDPRYVRTGGLTLLAALLVVAPVETQEISPEDRAAIEAGPAYKPFTIRPTLANRDEVVQALMREYPPALRDARIGGEVVVWFYVSDAGRVLHSEVDRSSGREDLDQAALEVADVFQFTPAIDPEGERPIAAWIRLPITFAVG